MAAWTSHIYGARSYVLLFCLFFQAATAQNSNITTKLAAHETWRKLLHYEPVGASRKPAVSVIHSDEFFLATDGRTDPESELRKTLAGMKLPPTDDINHHPQCRFPARFRWLKTMGMLADVVEMECPQFNEWIHGNSTSSVSIVFATGYLGNPASYYGHMLLKFNSSKSRGSSKLQDVTVNYGAIVPPDIGTFSYIYNGTTGGFEAGFSHIEYYFHDHNYGEIELRDLWEYELNLKPYEVRFILAHAWEVLGKKYTYYFFRKNCAYRLAEIVELIDGVEIIPPKRPWAIPQSLIQRAAALRRDGVPLISRIVYHPSRQSQFYSKFQLLGKQQREALHKLVRAIPTVLLDDFLSDMGESQQQAVVDTLIDYYQYVIDRNERPDSSRSQQYRNALAHRFKLPPGKPALTQQRSLGPERGRLPGLISVESFHNDHAGSGLALRVRPAYYDALDAGPGHVANSMLSMGEVKIHVRKNRLTVREFSLFKVEAVNGSVSGLPGDNGRAWKLAGGLIQQDLRCTSCLVPRFTGDIGKSFSVAGIAVAGVYVGGAIHDNRNGQGNSFLRVSAFLNFTEGTRFRLRAIYEGRYTVGQGHEISDTITVEARLAFARNLDLRLRVEKNVSTEVGISFGFYW